MEHQYLRPGRGLRGYCKFYRGVDRRLVTAMKIKGLSPDRKAIVLTSFHDLDLLTLRTGITITLDRALETIVVEEHHVFLIRRRRVIPYSSALSVAIDYSGRGRGTWSDEFLGGGRQYHTWRVSICSGDGKVKLAQSGSKKDMLRLAWTISGFTGKWLDDNSEVI